MQFEVIFNLKFNFEKSILVFQLWGLAFVVISKDIGCGTWEFSNKAQGGGNTHRDNKDFSQKFV